MFKFKSSSQFTNKITILAENFCWESFEEQVDVFNQHWFTVKVRYDYELGSGTVDIVFTHSNKEICLESAIQFVTVCREFDWWKEV